jgi:hypothetical protein
MQTRVRSMERKMTEEKEVEMKTKPLQLVTSATTRPPTTAAKACCAQSRWRRYVLECAGAYLHLRGRDQRNIHDKVASIPVVSERCNSLSCQNPPNLSGPCPHNNTISSIGMPLAPMVMDLAARSAEIVPLTPSVFDFID